MGNCCGGSATVPSTPTRPPLPAPTQETAPSSHPIPSSYAPSSKGSPVMPTLNTAQHDYEMTSTTSPTSTAVTPERQDPTSSQRRRDDMDYPPPSSRSNPRPQEIRPHPFRSRGVDSPSQIPAERQERRSHFPSTLQSLLPNDFRYMVKHRPVSHNS